jgi:hypothetical protein
MIDETSIVTLEHNQKCSECHGIVLAGTPIEQADWYEDWDDLDEDDEPKTKDPIYTCTVCAEIAKAFYCGGDGRMYGGGLWDDMSEVMGDLNSACFDRLKTPAAKAELQRRWIAWKGLALPDREEK